MHNCNVMLFAAGLGTRLRPFTQDHPKPCIGLLGVPLGYYLFPYFEFIKINRFVVNTFHLGQQVKDLYKPINQIFSVPALFSEESGFIKGSAGGLKQAENLFDPHLPVLVCNSDEVIFTQHSAFLNDLLSRHSDEKNLATLVVIKHPEAGKKFGAIWADAFGRVVSIGKEKPEQDGITPWHFVGLQILDFSIFDFIEPEKEQNIFYDVLVHFLSRHPVKIFPLDAEWYETGNLQDYSEAKLSLIEKNQTHLSYQTHIKRLNQIVQLTSVQVRDLP